MREYESRYVMSKHHPDYLNDRGRYLCLVESVSFDKSDGSAIEARVLWYDKYGEPLGYESIPITWLALKEEDQVPTTCVSIW